MSKSRCYLNLDVVLFLMNWCFNQFINPNKCDAINVLNSVSCCELDKAEVEVILLMLRVFRTG